MKQRAFVVSYMPNKVKDAVGGIEELNKLLEAGWAVQGVHAMGAAAGTSGKPTDHAIAFATLVVVEDAAEPPKVTTPRIPRPRRRD